MVLQLSDAAIGDVDRIASLHLAAFDSNVLLHAQFPTPESLSSLHSLLSQEMLHTIQNAQAAAKTVMVVRDTEAENQIISFAKWDLPGVSKVEHHAGVIWHEDVRQEFLEIYHKKAEHAKARVVGDTPCYRKTRRLSNLDAHVIIPVFEPVYRISGHPNEADMRFNCLDSPYSISHTSLLEFPTPS